MAATANISLRIDDSGRMSVTSASLSRLGDWLACEYRVPGGVVRVPCRTSNTAAVHQRLDMACRLLNHWDTLEPAVRLALNSMGKDDAEILGQYPGGGG